MTVKWPGICVSNGGNILVGYEEKLTLVLRSVAVGVANERRLPVVVDVRVGDSDPITGVGNIDQTIIVVLVVGDVG